MEVADYNTDIIPQQTVAQLLAGNVVPGSVAQETANANSNTQVNQNYVGGTMYGTSYKSANNNARVEIFPSYDKTIGFVSYADNGNIAFETIIAGANQGDVIIGNYAGGQGVKWDQSAGTLNVLGNITANSIAAGATITSPNITGGSITSANFQTHTDVEKGIKIKTGDYSNIANGYIEFWSTDGAETLIYFNNNDDSLYIEGGDVVVTANITGNSDAKCDLGVSGLRWNNVWAKTTHFGDAYFANGFRMSEEGDDGINFYNKDNQKIMILYKNGDLAISGKIKQI